MRLVDYHSHTTRCGHAKGATEEYVLRALELGLAEFGISDHSPWMLQQEQQRLAMEWEEIPGYVTEVLGLQEKYNRDGEDSFRVRLAMEMDYSPNRVDIARGVAARYPWDYIIGSVHNLGLSLLGDAYWSGILNKFLPEEVCDYYFYLMNELIAARFCDVIGHLDLPKKYGVNPRDGFMRWIYPLIPAIKKAGLAVEINTSGCDYGPREVMPGWEAIEALVAEGVPLTLSSDSHEPANVGRYFEETVKKLRCLGLKEIVRFEKRQMIALPLDGLVAVK